MWPHIIRKVLGIDKEPDWEAEQADIELRAHLEEQAEARVQRRDD